MKCKNCKKIFRGDYCLRCSVRCLKCGNIISKDEAISSEDVWFCRDCEPEQATYRDFSNKIVGEIDENMPVTFGLEIELLTGTYSKDLSRKLPLACGVGEDGSIHYNDDNVVDLEITTPPLAGQQGLEYLENVCYILADNDCFVNSSCGLHLHLGVGDWETSKIIRLLSLYFIFEDLLFAIQPPSRQDNQYCRPVCSKYSLYDIKKCRELEKLEALWLKTNDKEEIEMRKKRKYDDSRYCGINLHCLLYNKKTLEVRHHAGTIDYTKMLNWIKINQAFVRFALSNYDLPENHTIGLKNKLDLFKRKITDDKDLIDYIKARLIKFNRNNYEGEE